MNKSLLVIMYAIITVSAHPDAQAMHYEIQNLGALDETDVSHAIALNNLGQVVGVSYNYGVQPRAVLWTDGWIQDLGYGSASSINDSGRVAGARYDPMGYGWSVAAIWYDGAWHDVPRTGYYGYCGSSWVNAINDQGHLAGSFEAVYGAGVGYHAFLYDGGWHDLGGDWEWYKGVALNERDDMVGSYCGYSYSRAAKWDEFGMTTLSDLYSEANDINNSGQIVGMTMQDYQFRAVLWHNGTTVEIGGFDAGGLIHGCARAINNSGAVVGGGWNTISSELCFIWQDGVLKKLQELIPADSEWLLRMPYDINDVGQIVGYGQINSAERAFLMTPVIGPWPISISPSGAANNGPVHITQLRGDGFEVGATVKLTKPGQPDVTAGNVTVQNSASITCDLELAGIRPGLWNVKVQNHDGKCATNGIFEVTAPASAPVTGIGARGTMSDVARLAGISRRFRVWGKVTAQETNYLTLDDGSGIPVKVYAPGYSGMSLGRYICATGSLDNTVTPPLLMSSASQVQIVY